MQGKAWERERPSRGAYIHTCISMYVHMHYQSFCFLLIFFNLSPFCIKPLIELFQRNRWKVSAMLMGISAPKHKKMFSKYVCPAQ